MHHRITIFTHFELDVDEAEAVEVVGEGGRSVTTPSLVICGPSPLISGGGGGQYSWSVPTDASVAATWAGDPLAGDPCLAGDDVP